MRVHVWPSAHWVDDETFATIVGIADQAEHDIRVLLPALADDVYLLVNQTDQVIPETGDGGYTLGPHVIRWDVNPSGGIADIARAHLRQTLFHECHHSVRLAARPEDFGFVSWPAVAVFEGMASVFEDEAGGTGSPWRDYAGVPIAEWARELFAQPLDETFPKWKFEHPDGRRNIAYRVGAWVVDEAVARSGRSAAELVAESPESVLALAGLS